MHYLIVSFSHKNSDIAVREKLAFGDESKEKGLKELTENHIISEAVILSTCNRVEVFVSAKESALAIPFVFSMLSSHSGLSIEELEGRADIFENEGAIHHLFAVASSLDSVVIGETQIPGQIKEAFKFSQERGYCAHKIARAMQYAFRCAAEVRNQTEIAKKPVSVASVAVDKAKKMLGGLDGVKALVLGTGEMGELACRYLLAGGAEVTIVSRSLSKAEEMAKELGKNAKGADYSSLKEMLCAHTLLFSATGAEYPIIKDDVVEKAEIRRIWFDISVPRDIEIGDHHGIEVVTVDDLQDIVAQNQMLRAEEAKTAYSLVGSYTMEFFRWINALSVDPIIKELRQKAQDIAERELKNAIKKGFPRELEEDAAKLLHSAFKKFLHEPTVNLKALASSQRLESAVETLKYLHNLESDTKESYKIEQITDEEKEGI